MADKRKDTSVAEDFTYSSNTKLTQNERELVINYCEYDRIWYAESSIPKFWRRLEKKGWICTGTQYYPDGTVCSKSFTSGNSKGISITDPNRVRTISEESKQKTAARLKAYHEQRKLDNNVTNAEDSDDE